MNDDLAALRRLAESSRRALDEYHEEVSTKPTSDRRECACRDTLIDWVRQTVSHPYVACPFYGDTSPLDREVWG